MQINGTVFHRSLHLDNDKLAPPDLTCPLCGCQDRFPLYTLQERPEVRLLKCTNCNAASASRMPSEDALREYYSSYYEPRRSSESGGKVTCNAPLHFSRHLAKTILQYSPPQHVAILDFGGGDGTIALLLAVQLLQNGVDGAAVTVIDYNDDIVSSEDSRITINKVKSLEMSESAYDIVLASAIIEHLPQPGDVLQGLLNRLKRGGVFYARTPYLVPFMQIGRLMGIAFDFTYPGHVHDLGQDFWETYFRKGLAVGDYQILKSTPSIVETTIKANFLRAVAAYAFKVPWHVFGRRYKLVGGWEIFVRKNL